MRFESYVKKCKNKQPEKPLSINELKDAFFSLDINKSPGFDDISFTALKIVLVPYINPCYTFLIYL